MTTNAWMYLLASGLMTKLGATAITNHVGSDYGPHGEVTPSGTKFVTYVCPIWGRSEFALGSNDPAIHRARVQVDAWAQTTADALQLGDAVFTTLNGTEIPISNWGTARLILDVGPLSMDEDIEGVTYRRLMFQFSALLCAE